MAHLGDGPGHLGSGRGGGHSPGSEWETVGARRADLFECRGDALGSRDVVSDL